MECEGQGELKHASQVSTQVNVATDPTREQKKEGKSQD